MQILTAVGLHQGWISDIEIDGPTFDTKKWLTLTNLGQGLSHKKLPFFS